MPDARLAEKRGWLVLRSRGLSPPTFCQLAWRTRPALAYGSERSIARCSRIVQPSSPGGAMDDARLFLCARCRRQVLICSVCDRGQQYCGARCSGLARDDSLRAAGRRYQQSRRGRHCHAERQRRYRRRRRDGVCREKVTHHGSAASRCGAPLVRQRVLRREASPSMSPKPVTKRARAASGTSKMQCHFCARPISEFVRLHWRRSPIRRRVRPGARR